MKKNSIDNRSLCNRNYVLTCAAGFLLYVLVYAVIVSVTVHHSGWAGDICFPFAMGMLIVGPFHAWLADKFRRKHILTYPFLGLLVVAWGYAHVLTSQQFSLLALLQGMCFGLASSAGITLSIDVVHSGHRTKANMVYSLVCGLRSYWFACMQYRPLFIGAGVASGCQRRSCLFCVRLVGSFRSLGDSGFIASCCVVTSVGSDVC